MDKSYDLVFDGDGHINRWEKKETGKIVWDRHYDGRVANFGTEGDCIENLLWRLSVGQVDKMNPKAVVLLIGAHNIGKNTADEITEGMQTVVLEYKNRCPMAGIILMGIFPRNEPSKSQLKSETREVNKMLSQLHDGARVHFVDISEKLLLADGTLNKEFYYDSTYLSTKGYEIWASEIEPVIEGYLQ